jgi:hypothetical protein
MCFLCSDPDKKKYFKIEKSHTAPSNAAWSVDAVKRRRREDTASEDTRRRAHLVRNHVKRHDALSRDVVSRGLLSREVRGDAAATFDGGDVAAAAWAEGVVDKGAVQFMPGDEGARVPNMPCFYVGGDDEKTGMGVAYASE